MSHIRTDYHIHPDYSIDAFPVRIKDYCKKALELKLSEICFTTHVELDPVRREIDNFVVFNGKWLPVFDFAWLDGYFAEIIQAQQEFKDLKIKAGLEVGYNRGCEDFVDKIVSNYPFDFVLGAIHCLNHIAISSKTESPHYFRNTGLDELRKEYFRTLKEMVTTGLFDCIAHVDLYLRYGLKSYGPEILTIHLGVIEPIFAEMARRRIGLEVNTSSRRRGLKEFHPAKELLALAAKAGITIFTVGSDAHFLTELGGYIDEALARLQDLNLFNHVFTRRQAVPVC